MKKTLFSALIAAVTAVSLFSVPVMAQDEKPCADCAAPAAQVQADEDAGCPQDMQKCDKQRRMHRGRKGGRHFEPGCRPEGPGCPGGPGMGKGCPGPDPDMHLKMLTKELNLNADQQEKVGRIIKQHDAAMKQKMEAKRAKFEAEHKAMREEMEADHAAFSKEINSVLTAEQKTKFAEMEKKHKAHGAHPGMPGSPRCEKMGQPGKHGKHHRGPGKDCKPCDKQKDCKDCKPCDKQKDCKDCKPCDKQKDCKDCKPCDKQKDCKDCKPCDKQKDCKDCKPCDKQKDCRPCDEPQKCADKT